MSDCSIIIPVHNRASLTRQCLNRLLKVSTSAHPEIIVIDGASTDITPELLRSYGDQIRVQSVDGDGGFRLIAQQLADVDVGSYRDGLSVCQRYQAGDQKRGELELNIAHELLPVL